MPVEEQHGVHRLAHGFVMIILPHPDHYICLLIACNNRCVDSIQRIGISQRTGCCFIDHTRRAKFLLVEITATHKFHTKSFLIAFVNPHNPERLLLFIRSADSMYPFIMVSYFLTWDV